MSEEKNEVFRGHFDECLQHLGAYFESMIKGGSRGAAQAKKPIADFCGVSVSTVVRWLYDNNSSPVGEARIKLMSYLDMIGYVVIELEKMPKYQRNFAELIGYGLITAEKAVELLGYGSTSTLYQVLQGHHGASGDKEQKMWDMWKARKDELVLRKEESQELYSLDASLKIRSRAEDAKPAILPVRQMAVVKIMEGLLLLLEEGPLSESNNADLQRSADTILRLSAHMSTLSSQLIMFEQRKGGI